MLVFEAAMLWSALDDSWHQLRPRWVNNINAAQSDAQVAGLLLVLESMTLWSAVHPAWRGIRPGWAQQLYAIAGAPDAAPSGG
jgi:hypothetical protein